MISKKTDNSNLGAKLALRRHFLTRYHPSNERLRVFDCCQGSGKIWSNLRRDFRCDYWGVDLKPARARLAIDSRRILELPGWYFDVIDCDTYGEPWGHWQAILANVRKPVTIFLTLGDAGMAISNRLRDVGGFGSLNVPRSLAYKAKQGCVSTMLADVPGHVKIVETAEPASDGRTRYIGVRLDVHPIKPAKELAESGTA